MFSYYKDTYVKQLVFSPLKVIQKFYFLSHTSYPLYLALLVATETPPFFPLKNFINTLYLQTSRSI